MKRVFDHPVKGRQAVGQLLDLTQGNQSVSQYAINFHILAAESGWGDSALQAVFFRGLVEEIKDQLTVREESSSFNALIDLAFDNRLRDRKQGKAGVEGEEEPFPS